MPDIFWPKKLSLGRQFPSSARRGALAVYDDLLDVIDAKPVISENRAVIKGTQIVDVDILGALLEVLHIHAGLNFPRVVASSLLGAIHIVLLLKQHKRAQLMHEQLIALLAIRYVFAE